MADEKININGANGANDANRDDFSWLFEGLNNNSLSSNEKRKRDSNDVNGDIPSTKISKEYQEILDENNYDDYVCVNCKIAVEAFEKNGSLPLHSLHPQPSLRSYTKENKESFWNDLSIKLKLIGTAGSDNYMFYLYRDNDGYVYNIYTIAHDKYYVSHKYEKGYVEPSDF